jgi:hypothetical protein
VPNHGRRLALISEKRMFTVAVSNASVAMEEAVSVPGQDETATNCESPPYTKAIITCTSVSVKFFCAHSAPNAIPKAMVPGSIGVMA